MDLRGSLRLFRGPDPGMATSLAAVGHVLGGGALPSPGTIAVLTAQLPGPQ